MVSLADLYEDAARQDIGVDYFPLKHREALCIVDQAGQDHIAIDPRRITSPMDEKLKLAHEMGHCETGSFYGRRVPFETRARCECRANRHMLEKLLPYDQLMQAFLDGHREPWDLAEHLDVPEQLIHMAFEYYRQIP